MFALSCLFSFTLCTKLYTYCILWYSICQKFITLNNKLAFYKLMDLLSITEITDMVEGEDYIFKIVIIGDSGVGKSNILSRFIHNEFTQESKATVGVELQSKVYLINGKKIKVQLWDTAGQERYKSITAAYFKGAKGAMIVYDITNPASFDSVDRWHQSVKEFGDPDVSMIQIGNKNDLKQNRKVEVEKATEKAKTLGKYMYI